MTADLTYTTLPDIDASGLSGLHVTVMPKVNDAWINALFALKKTDNDIHRRIVPSMYAAIPKDEIAMYIENEAGEIIATGLGILDRDYVGIYAIHVHENYRRRGLARYIVASLLKAGYDRGASHAYLQVVSSNAPAKALYRSLGFQIAYRCWFRVNGKETGL
jgi:ribosomal protein S18 acetylase RimI-like enzyme